MLDTPHDWIASSVNLTPIVRDLLFGLYSALCTTYHIGQCSRRQLLISFSIHFHPLLLIHGGARLVEFLAWPGPCFCPSIGTAPACRPIGTQRQNMPITTRFNFIRSTPFLEQTSNYNLSRPPEEIAEMCGGR